MSDDRTPRLTRDDMYGPGYGIAGSFARFLGRCWELDIEVKAIKRDVAAIADELKSIPWDRRFVERGLIGWVEGYTHREEAERVPAGRPVPLNPNQDPMVEENRGLIAAEQQGLPGAVCLSWPDEPAHPQELQSERRGHEIHAAIKEWTAPEGKEWTVPEAVEDFRQHMQAKLYDYEGIEVVRVDGQAICPDCGMRYDKHPWDTEHLSALDGKPFLRVGCDGTGLKL